jgi:Domain of unknown function (DUF4328)
MGMDNHHTFRSVGRISKWLVNWSIASIVLSIIYVVSSFILLYLFVYYAPNNLSFLVGQLMLIIHIVIGIMTLFWYYRANKNIHAFGAKELTSPAMSVIWWFIPIAFFWKPYNITQQIWKASNPEVMLTEGIEWKEAPSSNTVRVWWIIGILAILIRVLAGTFLTPAFGQFQFTPHYVEEPNLLYKGFVILLTHIPGIVSAVYFIQMIKQVSAWQERKGGAKS